MALDPSLRAGDDDRDRVASVLRDAYAEGRLPPAEFEARLQAAYEATTIGELLALVADLPDRGGALAELRTAPVPAPASPGRSPGLGFGVGTWAVPVLVLVVLLVVVTRGGALRLWPVWLIAGAAVVALIVGRTGNKRD
jgi:Domain of unknown function (DUF1707)